MNAVDSALTLSGLKSIESKVACFGMSGLDSPSDKKVIVKSIEDLRLAGKKIVVHDSMIALYGGTTGKSGIVLIAGTGSVSAGNNKEGSFVQTEIGGIL